MQKSPISIFSQYERYSLLSVEELSNENGEMFKDLGHYRRFAHFPSKLLKSLDRGFAKSVMRSLQPIDFRGLIKMTEPWVISL